MTERSGEACVSCGHQHGVGAEVAAWAAHNAPDALLCYDEQGVLVWASAALGTEFGVDTSAAVGTPFVLLGVPGVPQAGEGWWSGKDGRQRWLAVRASEVVGPGGAVHTVLAARDCSGDAERLESAQRLADSSHQLAARATDAAARAAFAAQRMSDGAQ